MAEPVLISICIPAYKNPEFLKRLLDSIVIQTFKDFEVIITDDSPDDQVGRLADTYKTQFSLRYSRNSIPAGTPQNWNQAIRMASGQWIKIIHDDDWFSDKDALGSLATFINQYPQSEFIFSAYENIFLKNARREPVFASKFRLNRLKKNPAILFSRNIIGPPSVTIHRSSSDLLYDKQLKWLVDIDFYIRCLEKTQPVYIPKALICVGISDKQVTMDCFRRRPVEIPENFYLLNRVGRKNLRNILVYDAWWRLMRNLEIRKPEEIREAGYSGEIGTVIISMIRWQSGMPAFLLQRGIFSKCIMFLHYILNYGKIQN
jgi:glycosyltransferase involved in cell wall biosynthesis